MQRVYLLLRQNQQTGPFSLEELLQFNLKSFDLIWIEGKSAGWYYPQEIEALKPHLKFANETGVKTPEAFAPAASSAAEAAPKKIFVSMPASAAKPDARPTPLTAATPATETAFAQTAAKPQAELKTAYAKSVDEVETDYMNWSYQKATAKKKPLFSKSGLVVLCLVGGALFATWKIANRPKAEEPLPVAQNIDAVQPDSSFAENKVPVTATAKPQRIALVSTVAKSKKEPATNANKVTTAPRNAEADKPVPRAELPKETAAKETVEAPAPAAKEPSLPAPDEKAKTASVEAPKEKKKLRDKIYDIFHKKQPEESTESQPTENNENRRESAHRTAGSSLTQMVVVRFTIPNDWMMGVKGAKATLTNKSSETLAKAVIEVVYYNDDNEVLAKKTIQFSNVKSKQTQTVSVAEHETATRLEYNVISAVGTGEPVAAL